MTAPSRPLRVALCQMSSVDDVSANLKQIKNLIEKALEQGSLDLICLPENALYMRVDRDSEMPALRLSDEPFVELHRICQQHSVRLLIGSSPIADRGRLSNATVWMTPNQPPHIVYRKIHLFDVDVIGQPGLRESDSFLHGEEPAVLNIEGWRFGLSICYDLRFAELYSRYARERAHVMFIPSAFLVPTGKAHWHVLVRARAIENQAFVLAPAQSGDHFNERGHRRQTYGHSLAVDPWGEVLVDMMNDAPKVEVLTLEPECLTKVWSQIPQLQHRRLE